MIERSFRIAFAQKFNILCGFFCISVEDGLLELAHVLSGVQPESERHDSILPSAWQHFFFTETVSDSREVVQDSLFVALAGERTDGHLFLADVAARGARGALVKSSEMTRHHASLEAIQRPWRMLDGGGRGDQAIMQVVQEVPEPHVFLLIAVDDPLKALQRLALYHRSRLTPTVVGITGSVGKTSTKEVAAAVLHRRFCTLKSKKSYNSEVTLPTTLLHLTAEHEAAVVEMGMWAPGEIRLLASLARPHIGIVTNVGPSHLERMGSFEAIINAKAELVEALPANGVAILNADDVHVAAMANRTQARVFRYGLISSADVWADAIQSLGVAGIAFRLHYGDEAYDIRLPFPGTHYIYTALAATAVGIIMGVPWEDILSGLQDESVAVRMNVVESFTAEGKYTLIDDTYNASPMSTLAALSVLAECAGRRIAILGDMLELGSFAEEGHRMVGRRVAEVADRLVCVGRLAHWFAEEAHACGMARDHITLFEQSEQVIPEVLALVAAGDYILVKGSRGIAMEQIVTALTCEHPQNVAERTEKTAYSLREDL